MNLLLSFYFIYRKMKAQQKYLYKIQIKTFQASSGFN